MPPSVVTLAQQTFPLLFSAALLYSSGGLLMKLSAGLTRPDYTLLLLVTVVLGAVLQTLAVRHAQPAATYLLVLGLEAALVLVGSTLLFRESLSLIKLLGLALILGGIGCLRAGAS